MNDFSDMWLSVFLDDRDADATRREAAFVASFLASDSTVLDVPCGFGRHSAALGTFGHNVVGLDRDIRMVSRARFVSSAVQADMCRLPFATNGFDAAMNMWQSFGYFSSAENAAILAEFARIVRPGGLLVLDLYTRAFYETVPGERCFVRGGVTVQETISLRRNRVQVRLVYNGVSTTDEFEWQVFTALEMERMAAGAGWALAGRFTDFDRHRPAREDSARIQYVFRQINGWEIHR